MTRISRREMLAATAGAAALAAFDAGPAAARAVPQASPGRLKQSVCRWPFARIPLPDFCHAARAMGLDAIDLLQPDEWPVAREAGLVCSMGYPSRRQDFIARGFNDRASHDLLVQELGDTMPLAAQAGVPNLIAMFGNRGGRTDDDAVAACIDGLRRVAPLAESHAVTVCVELLNSKVDHADYQGDHTAFGLRVITGVGSPRVKLLYDIYHMQIMEGDVIRTIRDHVAHIGHFHTGGVPGRHEIDDTQELNYHAIARAIADSGFAGYLAHEFEPTRDPLLALRNAAETCRV